MPAKKTSKKAQPVAKKPDAPAQQRDLGVGVMTARRGLAVRPLDADHQVDTVVEGKRNHVGRRRIVEKIAVDRGDAPAVRRDGTALSRRGLGQLRISTFVAGRRAS